jgi:hypothetical protein
MIRPNKHKAVGLRIFMRLLRCAFWREGFCSEGETL